MFGTVYHYAGDGLALGKVVPSVARTGFGGHLGRMLSWRYCFQCHYLFGKGDGFVCRNDDDFHGAGSCSYTIDYLDDKAGTFVHVDALSMFFSIVQSCG